VKEPNTTRTPDKAYKVIIILLVSLAAFSSALRDLNRLQEVVGSLQEFSGELLGVGLNTAEAKGISASESLCLQGLAERVQGVNATEEFRWSGRIAQGSAIEIKGINGDLTTEAATGDQVEVIAKKKARRSNPDGVAIKVVEHAGGVTICAVYPNADPDNPNSCEPGKGGHMNVRNNDVQVDFSVRVPAGVGFIGRTVNGGISATSLSGNVMSSTVNGSVKISTSGYAQAKTVNGEISVKIGDANWPDSLEFTTVNGEISLDLPATVNTEIKADTFNGEISSDFPLSLPNRTSRKHLSGRIGNGGRELILKTLNGGINLRRTS